MDKRNPTAQAVALGLDSHIVPEPVTGETTAQVEDVQDVQARLIHKKPGE